MLIQQVEESDALREGDEQTQRAGGKQIIQRAGTAAHFQLRW